MSAPTTRRGILGTAGLAAAAAMVATGAAPATEGDDARLIALCAECVELQRVYNRTCWASDGQDRTHGSAETARALQIFEATDERQQAVMQEIATIRARTPAGLAAKGRAIFAFYDPEPPEDGYVAGDMLWSLVLDAAGAAGA